MLLLSGGGGGEEEKKTEVRERNKIETRDLMGDGIRNFVTREKKTGSNGLEIGWGKKKNLKLIGEIAHGGKTMKVAMLHKCKVSRKGSRRQEEEKNLPRKDTKEI